MRILLIGYPSLLNQSIERTLSENGFQIHLSPFDDLSNDDFHLSKPPFNASLLDLFSLPDPKESGIKSISNYNFTGPIIAVHKGYSEQELAPYLQAGCDNHISWNAPTEKWINLLNNYS